MELMEVIKKNDYKEPIIIEWGLNRITDFRAVDENKALEIENLIFTDDAIRYMVDNLDTYLLNKVLRIVSPPKFSGCIELLVQKYPSWSGDIASSCAAVIAKNNPAEASSLFIAHCSQGKKQFEDVKKMTGLLDNLKLIENKDAKQIAGLIIDAYGKADFDQFTKTMLAYHIVNLSWKYDHHEYDSFTRDYIKYMPDERFQKYEQRISYLQLVFIDWVDEYRYITNRISKTENSFGRCVDLFYTDAIPHDQLETAIGLVEAKSYDALTAFYKEYAHIVSHEKLRKFLIDVADDKDFIESLNREKQLPYFHSMILASFMASIKIKEKDLSAFTLEEVISHAASDIRNNFEADHYVNYFKTVEKQEVIEKLSTAFNNSLNHHGSGNIARIMGELGWEAFIKILAGAFSAKIKNTYLHWHTENAIVKYRDSAVDYFNEHLDEFDSIGKITALFMVKKIGGTKAKAFVHTHFKVYWKDNKEELLNACEALCSFEAIKRIGAKIKKGQPHIDRAFIVLSLLSGERTPDIEKMLLDYYGKRQEKIDNRDAFLKDAAPKAVGTSLDMELKCKNCNDAYIYTLKNIEIDATGTHAKPEIKDRVKCLNCGQFAEFDFTPKGMMLLSGTMMRIMVIPSDDEKRKALEGSPFKIKAPQPSQPESKLTKPTGKISRNSPCPCGSGKKFKKCCLLK